LTFAFEFAQKSKLPADFGAQLDQKDDGNETLSLNDALATRHAAGENGGAATGEAEVASENAR
jgi:hypothetical protein